MRLGILLTDPGSAATVRGLTEAAQARGWEVRVFLMDKGVHAFPQLRGTAAQLAYCAHSARQEGVGELPGLEPGSQLDWALTVDWADRVLAFG